MLYEIVDKVTMIFISSSANHLHDKKIRFKLSDLKTSYLDIVNNAY